MFINSTGTIYIISRHWAPSDDHHPLRLNFRARLNLFFFSFRFNFKRLFVFAGGRSRHDPTQRQTGRDKVLADLQLQVSGVAIDCCTVFNSLTMYFNDNLLAENSFWIIFFKTTWRFRGFGKVLAFLTLQPLSPNVAMTCIALWRVSATKGSADCGILLLFEIQQKRRCT